MLAVTLVGFGKGGFSGLGVLAVPVLALAAPPVRAAAIILPILMAQDVVTVWLFRRAWDRRIVALLAAGGAIGVFAGFAFAARVSTSQIELALGIITAAFGAYQWLAPPRDRPGASFPSWLGVIAGVVAGFTSQIAHAGGPPVQIYLMPQKLDRAVFLGTMAVFFAVLNWMKVPAYAALGQFTRDNLVLAGALLPVAVLSTWVGAHLARAVAGRTFYQIIYALMIVLGAKLIWDGATGLTA